MTMARWKASRSGAPDRRRSPDRRPRRPPSRRPRRRSRLASPATAPSIASRWSPWASIVPPRSPPVPRTAKPSAVASMSAPSPRRPSTTVAIRSDSFSRSSCAPSTTVSPSAKQPSSATSGSSSIASGTSSAVTRVRGRAGRGRPRARTAARCPARRSRASSSVAGRAPRPSARGCGRSRRGSSCAAIPRHDQPRAGDEHGRGDVEGGRRRVARDVDRVERELVAGGVTVIAVAVAGRGRRRRAASSRSVWSRLGSGSTTVVAPAASRPASSTQRLDLGGGDRQRVLDPVQRPPGDRERREAPLARLEPRAHRGERPRDAVDRAAADARVAVERPAAAVLPGEPAGQQPQQRAGVADVDRGAVRGAAQAGAVDHQRAVALLDPRAQRADRRERRVRVGRGEVVRHAHGRGAHRPQQRGAMRDRLVRRRLERAADRGARPEAGVHARATGSPRSAISASAWAARSAPAIQRTM